jgi:nucleoside-diphosphate-sugar epimerase
MRVAVFGASGFVGATLVERLWRDPAVEVVPVIHSSGNAARLARFGKPLVIADALQPRSIDSALEGCSHVVNCSRGPAEVMLRGLRNLLEASQRANVARFVHLSSVAAYGNTSVPVLDEAATPSPSPNTYGWMKLSQDQMVERAAARGLPCTVLCPPNISGSYSPFLLDILQTIRRGEFALVDNGGYPCELVDVQNLAHAIQLALHASSTDAGRIFVTDGVGTTWADVANALAPLAELDGQLPSIDLDAARRISAAALPPRPTILRTLKHLGSPDFFGALRKDPLLASAEKSAKAAIRRVPSLERALRQRFEKRPNFARRVQSAGWSERLIGQQLRNVRYSQSRAQALLGYQPVVSADQSMAAFRSWYADLYGWNDASWPLIRHLYQS